MTLEEAFKKAAYKVWNELEPIPKDSKYHVYEIREEGLTTMSIKELIRSSCTDIEKIIMIPPKEEKVKGYDFELAIGSPSKGKFIRLFIQAKTLKGKKINSRYEEIDFPQATVLSDYSKSERSLGMYAFFNHLTENTMTLQNHYNSLTPFDKESLGITIASAYSIRMLKSKLFSDYHFNAGLTISPKIRTWRYFSHLFYFHRSTRGHLAVPFHELSYFTVEMAEMINKAFKIIKRKGRANFFFFFLPGIEELFGDDDEIIPILKTNVEELIKDFNSRAEEVKNDIYKPQALIIINTDN
jgi:hypothetical protein